MKYKRFYVRFLCFSGLSLLVVLLLVILVLAANQVDIGGPVGSGKFGLKVTLLPNGNLVVRDPYYDGGDIESVGAVYLYDGESGVLISMLTGSTAGDMIGFSDYPYKDNTSLTVLSNGNFVVVSPHWDNGAIVDAGAVTWVDGMTGVSGVVSAGNSLVGRSANDYVGGGGVTALINGNYVVASPGWDNGTQNEAGAVTWGDGMVGTSGVVSVGNSLVGSSAYGYVGSGGVTALSNGNFVAVSASWANGTENRAGAVTWGDGMVGISGVVSAGNSLVGSSAYDRVGGNGVLELTNGNFVVVSPFWTNGAENGAGAVTWGDGMTGVSGVVSASNSLVGCSIGDHVGNGGITALTNGNYVVASPGWDNGTQNEAGAVTWGNGMIGISGVVSAGNSLVGSSANDYVGGGGVIALSNGNFVAVSPSWANGIEDGAGAVTWGDGTTGINGVVGTANSLVGSSLDDAVGRNGVIELTNGNYVVVSPYWANGTENHAGAVTWGDGMTGISGVVSAGNSLVGSSENDAIGLYLEDTSVIVLTNGNYVVASPYWDNSLSEENVGAATWGDGMTGVSGVVSTGNSLVGSSAYDYVGGGGVTTLTNGNYVVVSPRWANGIENRAGAATWGNGTTGIRGVVSSGNSLVGSSAYDHVGGDGVIALANGNYVAVSTSWSNGTLLNVGAATWGNGIFGISGVVSATNSLVGSSANDQVGSGGVTELSIGNYVVMSPSWDNGTEIEAGAVTWGDGMAGTSDVVSAGNSLVGSSAYDFVGDPVRNGGTTVLTNGNYVVASPEWTNGTMRSAGAVTWGDGTTGINGAISAANSLVGSIEYDHVGNSGLTALTNGNYVVWSTNQHALVPNAEAVTLGAGFDGSTVGPITSDNSVLGLPTDTYSMNFEFDYINDQLVVGRPEENIVTLFGVDFPTHQLTVLKAGSGSGTVSSMPSGIHCGNTCSLWVAENNVITLTAVANTGSIFSGWSGTDCFGDGPCVLTMDTAEQVTATFDWEGPLFPMVYLPIVLKP